MSISPIEARHSSTEIHSNFSSQGLAVGWKIFLPKEFIDKKELNY